MFMPDKGRSSTGITDKEGFYSLNFDEKHPGAVVGKHKVRISRDVEQDLAAGRPAGAQLPPQYNDATTLEKDVKEGENEANFDLTSS